MSLLRIVLRDFVIVQELDLEFEPGFTILTGETGAGKSLLIDALQLVTGGRADTGLIREGADKTDVSAEFASRADIDQWLERDGFVRESVLLLRRTLDSQGRSKAWINGSPCTATQLRALGEQLIDIHGQHAWQSLTRAQAVRELLDAYAGIEHAAITAAWRAWRDAQDDLDQASQAQDGLERERDRLLWQIQELEKLSPKAGEWPELNIEHQRLSHAQALIDAAQSALSELDEGERNASGQLSDAQDSLRRQSAIEPEFENLCEVLSSAQAQVDDACRSLRSYLRRTDPDPERLGVLDERLGRWLTLAKRYRVQPEDLAQTLSHWREELAGLEASTNIELLQSRVSGAWSAYTKLAREISASRKRAAEKLGKAVTLAMQGLGMAGGVFDVAVTDSSAPLQSGTDEVTFLVAGHTGSTPRPVSKVASGGELSRLALAIAVTTSRNGQAATLIFDEVDSGVGGSVAQTVGKRLRELGADRQVLAITHLPQVAACANHHLVVEKAVQKGSALSTVREVQGQAREHEVARMLGGKTAGGTTMAHAKELLKEQVGTARA